MKSGLVIAIGFVRVVHGGRGDYVEFLPTQILHNTMHLAVLKEGQIHTYFREYRVNDADNAMVYEQLRLVGYADYKLDYYYISPVFLRDFGVYEKRS